MSVVSVLAVIPVADHARSPGTRASSIAPPTQRRSVLRLAELIEKLVAGMRLDLPN